MLLGGSRYIIPVIEEAHKRGVYVITADYMPDNVAHSYADEYCNVSVVEREKVLCEARARRIDGIMSFACDPGVCTAAYVAERMGLPFQGTTEAVSILQDKGLFRHFLTAHGFNVPVAHSYHAFSDAIKDLDQYRWPLIIKPVDSAGSKGVSRVDNLSQFSRAVETALAHSISGRFIVEEFLEKVGCSSDSDCFTVDGRLVYCSFSDQMFDQTAANPYTPAAYSWPATMPAWAQEELRDELGRLVSLLHLSTGIYNVETRLCVDGKPYIMEVSPRGGGNRLAEMLCRVTSTDLIGYEVMARVGEPLPDISQPCYSGNLVEYILHSERSGVYRGLHIAGHLRPKVVETDMWVQEGDEIESFDGANHAIGTLVLRNVASDDVHSSMDGNLRPYIVNVMEKQKNDE